MMSWIAGTTSESSFTPHHVSNADGNANATPALASTAIPNDW
jgi:hypothetical protein